MKKYISALIFLAVACPAFAQEAPPPRKMPRVPVHREALQDHKSGMPAAREVQGQAIVIDGEKLRVGELDLRLFGVVPPQLSASFGPQARAALDELTAGQTITCSIRDRDRDERFLATCRNANNSDLALELLRRGLAVTARGSVATTDLASPYIAAEQAAAVQKVGLWSVAIPGAAAVTETSKIEAVAQPAPQGHEKTEEKPVSGSTKSELIQTTIPTAKSSTTSAAAAALMQPVAYPAPVVPSEPGFFVRYQLLITGLVMLLTAFGLYAAIAAQRWRDRRAEMQAIAAALRGELMAVHAVCRARLRSSPNVQDRDITWPRLRSTLYQAYVGRLGSLGAELARRIASIYGQASDYAAYFSDDDESRSIALPKRQALQALVQHIDDVLPRLAIIEQAGKAPKADTISSSRPAAVVVPMSSQANQYASRPQAATETSSLASSPVRIWTAVQKMARASWNKKKTAEPTDPIAEYTALIEEEMKRLSFVEDDESDQQSSMDSQTNSWSSQKVHEAY